MQLLVVRHISSASVLVRAAKDWTCGLSVSWDHCRSVVTAMASRAFWFAAQLVRLRVVVVAALVAIVAAGRYAQAQDSVHLRPSARVGARFTVDQIATLKGSKALTLGSIELARPANSIITLEMLRAAAVASGARVGQVAFQGSACTLLEALPAEPTIPAMPVQPVEEARDAASAAVPAAGAESGGVWRVEDAVRARLAQEVGREAGEVRIEFEERNHGLLAMPLDGERVAVTVIGTGERPSCLVRVYRGRELVRSESLKVNINVRRRCAVAVRAIRRGQVLTQHNVRSEERWMSPLADVADPENVIGSVSSAAIQAGAVIAAMRVNEGGGVRKGDVVMVDSVVGGIVVRVRARVADAAHVGEQVVAHTQPWNQAINVIVTSPGNATAIGPAPEAGSDRAKRPKSTRAAT